MLMQCLYQIYRKIHTVPMKAHQTLPELVVQNTHGKNKQKGNERCKGNISEVVHFLVN